MDCCGRNLDRDYMDYVEARLSVRRRMGLLLHVLRCSRCRHDVLAWPSLRRMVRQAERCVIHPNRMATAGTSRIRC